MTIDPEALPGPVGPYHIEARLGAGGMGEVFRAYDERLDRRVALKRIRGDAAGRPGARARFLREARAAARLNHPAIVHVHDVVEADDGDWIVMELAEGEPLARVLEAGPLAAARVVEMAREIAAGLAAAHAEGIVHRDLKSENVIVTAAASHRVKILDFGLAKPPEADADASLSRAGALLGTPRAMSPEQASGGEIDARTDLFSLGTLLYEMLTGVSPFLGANLAETLSRVCLHHPPPVVERAPETPRELSELIERLIEKEPSRRPESADQVLQALRRIAVDAASSGDTPAILAPAAHRLRPPAGDGGSEEEDQPRLCGERRQVTVMCCDLVGAATSASLDPEMLYEILPEFQRRATEAFERFGGHVGDVQGHRLVVYFGYPQAYGDDARRAALAALEIVERTARLAVDPELDEAERPAARVGIHTGSAVAVRSASGEHLALGETLDLATALQERAEPGSVVASAATRRLLHGFFAQEPIPCKGLETPACRVLSVCDVHGRFEAELRPFIGREQELELLRDRFQLAREGMGQAMLLSGEEGMGKSRLLYELRRRLAEPAPRWLVAYGSPYARDTTPFGPAADLLRRLLEIEADDPPGRRRLRLEEVLRKHHFPLAETLPLFAALLGLPLAGDELSASSHGWRRGILEALPALVLEIAERQPMVLVFEDLQWMDPSTLELIGRLIDQSTTAALLLILTCRPRFQAPWGGRAHLTQLRLSPLSDQESAALIDRLADPGVPAAARDEIAVRADGVPLFVEALVLEASSPESRADPAIPATLRDTLTARLDRLGTSKEVARTAAALGRELSGGELAALVSLDPATLRREIERLLDAEILVRRGASDQERYRFKYALVRDVAYASLLEEEKERLLQRMDSGRFGETAARRAKMGGTTP